MIGEATSAQDLVLAWRHAGDSFETDALQLRLENTTQRPLTLRLELQMQDPSGALVARPVETRTLAARQIVDLALPVALLPVQSSGAATPMVLAAVYDAARPALGVEPLELETHTLHAHAPPLHATFDAKFARATFRSPSAQASANRAARAAANPEPEPRGAAGATRDVSVSAPAYDDDPRAVLADALRPAGGMEALRVYDPSTGTMTPVALDGERRASALGSYAVDLPEHLLAALIAEPTAVRRTEP